MWKYPLSEKTWMLKEGTVDDGPCRGERDLNRQVRSGFVVLLVTQLWTFRGRGRSPCTSQLRAWSGGMVVVYWKQEISKKSGSGGGNESCMYSTWGPGRPSAGATRRSIGGLGLEFKGCWGLGIQHSSKDLCFNMHASNARVLDLIQRLTEL